MHSNFVEMEMNATLAAIIVCFNGLVSSGLTQNSDAKSFSRGSGCEIEVSSSHGEVYTQEASANWEDDNVNRSINSTHIHFNNLAARWSVMDGNPDRLLLSITFSARGSGMLSIRLVSSPRYRYPFFVGNLVKSTLHQNDNALVNVWLRCLQKSMQLDDDMSLYVDTVQKRKRRAVPSRISVDLPGCNLPEFKHSVLCQEEEDRKIHFHVRRLSNKKAVRVVLSRSVYQSRYEDKRRTRSRRYYVAILEEPPADAWLGNGGGRILEMQELKYPNRSVRFRGLKMKTYDVAVWRNGETKRYAKKIGLC